MPTSFWLLISSTIGSDQLNNSLMGSLSTSGL